SLPPDRRGRLVGRGGRSAAPDERRRGLQGQEPRPKTLTGSHCGPGGRHLMRQPCPAVAQLEHWLADRLDADADTTLGRHLEQCPRGQRELDRRPAEANGLGKRFRSAAPPPLPPTGEAFVRRLKQDTEFLSDPSLAPRAGLPGSDTPLDT